MGCGDGRRGREGRPEVVGGEMRKGRVESLDGRNAHAVGEIICSVGVVRRRYSFVQRVGSNAPHDQRIAGRAVAHP